MGAVAKKAKVLSGYRITIPEEIRKRLGIRVGQEVIVTARGGEIIIKVSEENPVFSLLGIAKGAPEASGDELFLKEVSEKGRRK